MNNKDPAFASTSLWIGRNGWSTQRRVSISARRCNLQMGLVSHEKLETLFGEEGPGQIAKYKLVLEIPGSFSRQQRKKSISSLKERANFPGFRKGTIPPFIKKDIDSFVLQESINNMLDEACTELGLKVTEGEKGGPEMDMDDIKSRFKVGTDFQFECTIPLEAEDKIASGAFMQEDDENGATIDTKAQVINS